MNLQVNGELHLRISNMEGVEIQKDEEKMVRSKLKSGDYLLSLNNKFIVELKNFQTPIYTFDFDVDSITEYDFIEDAEENDE